MATYAIGDVHGCMHTLERLVARLPWRAEQDRLWFVGDLVNRGRYSLETLQFVRSLGAAAETVLGNHDLRLVRMVLNRERHDPRGYLDSFLVARERHELVEWLRFRPLLIRENGFVLVHAGILPHWVASDAERRARRAEARLQQSDPTALLEKQRQPPHELASDESPVASIAADISVMTRLRVCDPEGQMVTGFDGSLDELPRGLKPWFELRRSARRSETVVFGHWSNLGLYQAEGALGLDTACVRGGRLTAVRLDDGEVFAEPLVAGDSAIA